MIVSEGNLLRQMGSFRQCSFQIAGLRLNAFTLSDSCSKVHMIAGGCYEVEKLVETSSYTPLCSHLKLQIRVRHR